MSKKIKRRKKVFTKNIGADYKLVMRLLPLIYTRKGCVWLVSLAVAKSRRQINDWLKRRRNSRVRRLDSSLTGKIGNRVQAIAVRQLRQWVAEHPVGDSLSFRCASAEADKQLRVWKKWFEKHELNGWEVNEELKSFFFYKSSV
ncbi:MAG: hypothetical protein EBS53_02135 [Bacteroidetes bacterium]|nr:hypothetical protein [Bacteroidota bacterium]